MIDVNREILSVARQNWEVAQFEDYLVEISVRTSGTDRYEVTVTDNEPVQVKLNGKALNRRHAFDTWTIAGMLDTIAIDIEHCERWDEGRASDNKTVTISRRVGDDKTQQTMEVFHKGRRVFSQELTSTRIKARQENVSP